MTASVSFLTILVGLALTITGIALVALLLLWLRDWKRGRLW